MGRYIPPLANNECNAMILIALLVEQFWTVNTYGIIIQWIQSYSLYLSASISNNIIAVLFRLNNSCLVYK